MPSSTRPRLPRRAARALAAGAVALLVPAFVGCGGDDALTVYSGRDEVLIGPVLDDFADEAGVELEVRYGDSAELAATILEEGDASPADVFVSQDAGSLGALEKDGLLSELDEEVLARVDRPFRSRAGDWVGISGRARVIAYDSRELSEPDLPDSVLDLTDPEWEGRVGWAPTNGSFQAFVTALRITEGEQAAREWLEGMVANRTVAFDSNIPIRDAIAAGEIDVGLINHYYVAEAKAEDPEYPVEVYSPPGDIGAMINVAGAGILASSDRPEEAAELIDFLLGPEAQRYFASETKEYPLIEGVEVEPGIVPLAQIDQPDVDLSNLDDLQGTLTMIEESGAL
ncbi:MAG TPA: iron ABC transporter substrate-binding protein [Solirubrobacterales bacterium]|nr:iron ABC transporter substrate-binding protein [Solirubrobacterales bacterium]